MHSYALESSFLFVFFCFVRTQSCWKHHANLPMSPSFPELLCLTSFLPLYVEQLVFSDSPAPYSALKSGSLINLPFFTVCISKDKGPCWESAGCSAENWRWEELSRQGPLYKWGWGVKEKKCKHSGVNKVITATLMYCKNSIAKINAHLYCYFND